MSLKITRDEYASRLHRFIADNAPRAYLKELPEAERFLGRFNRIVYLSYEAAFSCNVSIAVSLDNETRLSWSCSDRDIVSATACLAMYRTAVDFAAILEAYRRYLAAWLVNAEKETP